MAPSLLTEEEIREIYGAGFSLRESASMLGVSLRGLVLRMDELGIERRSFGGYPDDARFKREDYLRQKLVEEGESMTEVARRNGCSQPTIRHWVDEHDIGLE